MRIVFFGSGAFGVPTLHALTARHDIAAVVTNPPRPVGRGGRVSPTPIAAAAEQAAPSTAVLTPERVRDAADDIARIQADAWVVIAYGHKLPAAMLRDRFAVNLHGSLLPRWRGAAPVNAAVLAGDAHSGNSVISLADRMDAGLIYATTRRDITLATTATDLHDALSADGVAAVLGVLDAHAAGDLRGQPQNEADATTAGKLSKADGWVSFHGTGDEARRRINGLSQWPGVTAQLKGERLRLLRAAPGEQRDTGEPGELIDADAGDIACREGAVRLLEVQPANKRAMAWSDFARGRRLQAGARLIGHESEDATP